MGEEECWLGNQVTRYHTRLEGVTSVFASDTSEMVRELRHMCDNHMTRQHGHVTLPPPEGLLVGRCFIITGAVRSFLLHIILISFLTMFLQRYILRIISMDTISHFLS